MMQTVIMGIVNILFTVVAIVTVDRFGRKPLLIIGSIGMAVGAFMVAICDNWGIKGIIPVLSIIVYAAFFMMSWGPICWVLIASRIPSVVRQLPLPLPSSGSSTTWFHLHSRHCMISVRCLPIAFMESSASLPRYLFGVVYQRPKARHWKK